MLRSIRSMLTTSDMVTLYQSLVLPHFDYCCSLWGNFGEVLKSKLQTLQNRAARIITRSGFEVRSSEILANLGWADLETRRSRPTSTLMNKIMNDLAPGYLWELFTPLNEEVDYNLRQSDINVKIPQLHSEYLKRSLSYKGAPLWNNLPVAIRYATNAKYFNNLINLYNF